MRWPGQTRAAERFARAIDAGPDAGSAPASDAEVAGLVAVVEQLRSADHAADPAPAFRAQLRARLVSTATAEWAGAPPQTGPARPGAPADEPTALPGPRVRPRFALAAALAAVLVAAGLVMASGSALPGDLLYPVKRGTEQVQLAFVFGQHAKGRRYLALARTRAEEVGALLDRNAQGRSGGTPADIDAGAVSGALGTMDAQTSAGARLLSAVAVRQAEDGPLADLATWTADQRSLLDTLVDRLPASVRARASESLDLVRRVADRAAALRAQLSCSCLGTAPSDDLGPLPCVPCAASPGGQGSPTAPATSAGSRTGPGAGPGASGAAPSGASPGAGGGLPLPSGGGLPLPSVPGVPPPTRLPLPTVPSLPAPSLPAPSLPAPSLPAPSLPVPSPTVPSLPVPSLPVPSLAPPTGGSVLGG